MSSETYLGLHEVNGRAAAVEFPACPDCHVAANLNGGVKDVPLLAHADDCAGALALDEVCALDREWFEKHPLATQYFRPVLPGDFTRSTWDGIVLPPGEIPRVRVEQLEPGLRIRHLSEVPVAFVGDAAKAMPSMTYLEDVE